MAISRILIAPAAVLAVVVFLASVGSSGARAAEKSRFLVEVPHTPEQCMKISDELTQKPALLAKCDWTCMSGKHDVYAVLEGKDEAEVRAMLPKDAQSSAVITKVVKLTPKQIREAHKAK